MKAHTMFVTGNRDTEAESISVRFHGKGNLGAKGARRGNRQPLQSNPRKSRVHVNGKAKDSITRAMLGSQAHLAQFRSGFTAFSYSATAYVSFCLASTVGIAWNGEKFQREKP
jgi:hypothetical protein